ANGLPPAAPVGPAAGGAGRAGADPLPFDTSFALLDSYREQARQLLDHRCPADLRIEAFLADHLTDLRLSEPLRLPAETLVLSRHGIARELSLPAEGDAHASPLLSSYRVRNGVLHNPKNDKRTTAGTFHVAEGGLPVPGDKKAVPKAVFAELFRRAVKPPADLTALPFTGGNGNKVGGGAGATAAPIGDAASGDGSNGAGATAARAFVSLLLRPLVCPEVPGVCPRRTMEVRFFAPGSLVSNLDFVESIFGNAGDPFLPRNDAALDAEHWTGHTGCVILAPHLTAVTKKELGLPHVDAATPRQKRDKMCWRDPAETYNDGTPFKLTCRTAAGVIVTLIADNYYGYCKKEVKTQISYATNLLGNTEEEHAGGALAFASYSFGDEFIPDPNRGNKRTFADVVRDYGHLMDVRPEGYGVDKLDPRLVYIPDGCRASVARQQVWWAGPDGGERAIPMEPGKLYMNPSGFKLHIEKHPGAPSWRIIGTNGDGVFCHKPCTVSGGGKSEISKSIRDYMLYGPIFVSDVEKDFDLVARVIERDYGNRWAPDAIEKPDYAKDRRASRKILSPDRSLGSVIKLLTPSRQYSDAYNGWLGTLPNYIYPIVFIIKRFYRPEWGENWREHFGVDVINGFPGHELKMGNRTLVGTYLRVGLMKGGAWRTYKLRQDFAAAAKVQTEDDITASVVVPAGRVPMKNRVVAGAGGPLSFKFSENCEYRLFQRPDDAIHRGLDKQTELDMSRADNFFSNYEPLTPEAVRRMVRKVTEFEQFTPPMRDLLAAAAEQTSGYVVSSAEPRIVDGKPTANPRYLQTRPDLIDPLPKYAAEQGLRLWHAVPPKQAVLTPVDAVLVGRRNNPADRAANIRALAVYNPIHYQELPELFMDFVSSLTGKSPSTTGAGSEGALTKSPFNALRPIVDLNNALVSYVLTGLGGFSTAAGYVGPTVRVDHDVSLLVPEIWCRLAAAERDPRFLIDKGYLEKIDDFDHNGERILASRLGYRITYRFVRTFFGRLFDNPGKVFDEPILKPESQSKDDFADGVKNITEAQERVAKEYFEDGSVADACPPLAALLAIMAHGSYEGKDVHHPDVRKLFTRESLLASDWYKARLAAKQRVDERLWQRHVAYLDDFLKRPAYAAEAAALEVATRRQYAAAELARVRAPAYLTELVGTLGTDPSVAG
ncbi:MAG: hypothetical protein JWO31_4211, partial [Phycisphaerales bacterium]|nr:hypothetical protein [Phycisphaerales bacterium]